MHAEPQRWESPGARRLKKVGSYAILTLLAIVVLFPIYITVVNSLLRPVDIASRPPTFFPTHPHWSSYADAWNGGHMAKYLVNSFIVTIAITVGQVLTAVLAIALFVITLGLTLVQMRVLERRVHYAR